MKSRTSKAQLFIAVALTALLGGCVNATMTNQEISRSDVREVSSSFEASEAYLSDKTFRMLSFMMPMQIEYLAPNNVAYLWFPGNSDVYRGFWKLEGGEDAVRICFAYIARSFHNAVLGGLKTGKSSTEAAGPITGLPATLPWECRSARGFIDDVAETADGDIFDLTQGLPFIWTGGEFTFAEMQALGEAGERVVDPTDMPSYNRDPVFEKDLTE